MAITWTGAGGNNARLDEIVETATSAFSSGTGFIAVNFKSIESNAMSRALSGKQYITSMSDQRYAFTLEFPNMTRSEFQPIYGYLQYHITSLSTFTVQLPQYATLAAGGTLNTQIAAPTPSEGDTLIRHTSLQFGTSSGNLTVGDMIQFTDSAGTQKHDYKVYTIVGGDDADVNFFHVHPPLIASLISTDKILAPPIFKVRATSSIQEYKVGKGNLYSFKVDVEEAL